jgi:hypothetical protein
MSLSCGGEDAQVYDLLNCGERHAFQVGTYLAHNCNYGAGPVKLLQTLSLEGVDITLDEVRSMHQAYWETVFPGVREYMRELEREWRRRGGWVMGGTGRPIGVAERKRKDIMNSVLQGAGHDLLLKLIRIVADRLSRELGGPWYPVCIDWHDQLIIEVPEELGPKAEEIVVDSFRVLNEEIQGYIPIKGTGGLRHSMAECKLEEQDLVSGRETLLRAGLIQQGGTSNE